MINDNYIKENCFRNTGAINTMKVNKLMEKYPCLKTYLEIRYNDIPSELFSYKEVLLRIKNNVEKRPVCPICGGHLLLKPKTNEKSGSLYNVTCENKECKSKNKKSKISKTVKEQYEIFNKIKNDLDNFDKYSDEEKCIYYSILKGINSKEYTYNSYKFIKDLLCKNQNIQNIKELYPDEFSIYERLNSNLDNVRNTNTKLTDDYKVISELLDNNEFVDYSSDEYKNYISVKRRKETLSNTLRENQQDYLFILERLKTHPEEELSRLFPDKYNNYISHKNKLKSNKSKFDNYNFILRKISNENLTAQECECEYPNAYKDYLKVLEINSKINDSYKRNKTYNSSKSEELLFNLLKEIYPSVISQYRDDLYPYNCDFYIPEKKLYIEYQGSFFHNGKPYNEFRDKDELENIKIKADNIRKDGKINKYDNLIFTWTERDVVKRHTAKTNKLNYLEIFPYFELNIENLLFVLDKFSNKTHKHIIVGDLLERQYNNIFEDSINNGLSLHIIEDEINKEFYKFYNTNGDLNVSPNDNKIVLYFQEDNFYKREKELFSNDFIIRRFLIENRCKYLNKNVEDLTDLDLIRGFRISRLCNSYSHFSPLWVKYFIQKYDIKSIIDPFGGWGHHILGIIGTDCKYCYSDISENVVNNVDKMIKHFNLNATTNVISAENINMNNADAVFMCPPYFNIEIYENDTFETKDEYDLLMNNVFNNWKNGNIKLLGIIIREDFEYLFENIKEFLISKDIVNFNKDHYNKSGKLNEFLYIFQK